MLGYDDDREEQHDREHELTDDNGIGDGDGLNEQISSAAAAGRQCTQNDLYGGT
jgi:hypothetical protein